MNARKVWIIGNKYYGPNEALVMMLEIGLLLPSDFADLYSRVDFDDKLNMIDVRTGKIVHDRFKKTTSDEHTQGIS